MRSVIDRVVEALFASKTPGDELAAERRSWAKTWILSRVFPKEIPASHSSEAIRFIFRENILAPFAPEKPFLSRDARIASIGSCFAEEISKSLLAQDLDVAHVFMSERWNTAFALRNFLMRSLRGTPFPQNFIPEHTNVDEANIGVTPAFGSADVFVLTFGLSLCWFERATGEMVLEPPKAHGFQGLGASLKDYVMRQSSVEENEEAISSCIAEIKAFKPTARIVLTLSPIPLLAALTESSVVSANMMSKSVLHVALQRIAARNLDGVFYWPSYECVAWYGAHVAPPFGGDDRDQRHIDPALISTITQEFMHYFFVGGSSGESKFKFQR